MISLNMAVYQLKLTFLNQAIAPITMLLLPLTLCVQESDTKLFKLISHYTSQFVLKVVQVFYYPSLALATKHFCCRIFFFPKRGDTRWADTPNVILEPLEHSRKLYIRFDWEIAIVCAAGGGKKAPVEI